MHSVRIEPTKLILVGTRTTYHVNGGAGAISISCSERVQQTILGMPTLAPRLLRVVTSVFFGGRKAMDAIETIGRARSLPLGGTWRCFSGLRGTVRSG